MSHHQQGNEALAYGDFGVVFLFFFVFRASSIPLWSLGFRGLRVFLGFRGLRGLRD